MKLDPSQSFVLVVDVQGALSKAIWEMDRTVDRCRFLARIARLLDVPVLATEQNPSRMGATVPELAELVEETFAKMAFSALGSTELMSRLQSLGRRQAVVVGIETHICVSQSALGLLELGYEVAVCPDAVSARSVDRHKLGMERIRDAGVVPAHTEAVAYEWLGAADHPKFRDALAIVKAHP